MATDEGLELGAWRDPAPAVITGGLGVELASCLERGELDARNLARLRAVADRLGPNGRELV